MSSKKIHSGQYKKMRSDMAYCEKHKPKTYDKLIENIIMPLVNNDEIPQEFLSNEMSPIRVPNGKGVSEYDAIAEEFEMLTSVMINREFSYDAVSEVLMAINTYIHKTDVNNQ